MQIAYAEKPVDDYLVAAIDAVWKVHLNVGRRRSTACPIAVSHTSSRPQEPQGDILVFLTGRDEIDACMQALADRQVE